LKVISFMLIFQLTLVIAKKSGKPIKDSLIIHGEREKIQMAMPKGDCVN